MPWTRPTTASADGTTADPACWKTLYKHPFYYREADGRCYVTKSYCTDNIGEGGFAGSYGSGHDYLLLSNCTHPSGESNEIQSGYDCCTNMATSIADFFFGSSLPAMFQNAVQQASQDFSGNSPTTWCDLPGGPDPDPVRQALEPLVSFLSDERLKTNIVMTEENGVGMGINVYRYEWTPEAKRLYKKPNGEVEGLLMKELEQVFPQCVRLSPYGHKMFLHHEKLMPSTKDFKFLVYATVIVYLMGSNDVLEQEN
jgi:hypothetical protein